MGDKSKGSSMVQLDDNFLKDLGVVNLPENEKQILLQHIYEELEMRVGGKLADGFNDDQMREFDAITQRDESGVKAWLAANLPDYAQLEDYQRFMSEVGVENPPIEALADYTATKWLEVNKPDYRDVVAAVLAEIKNEIIANRDAILAT